MLKENSLSPNNISYNGLRDEGLWEESILMALILGCILLLPIKVMAPLTSLLYCAVIVFELLYMLVSAKRIIGNRLDIGLLISAAALFLYLLGLYFGFGQKGGERLIQTALFLLTLISFSRYQWTGRNVHRLFLIMLVLMSLCLAYWFVSGRITNYYSAFYGHGNGFAVVILAAIAITFLDCQMKLESLHVLSLVLCGILLSFTNSRSALLTCLIFIILVLALKNRDESGARFLTNAVFICILIGVLTFSIVYPSLYGTNLGFQLESLSREWLNKNFFSGRELVWKMVLLAVHGNEALGLGLQMTPSMIYNTDFSSHNMYLQTILQSGVVGLLLLLCLFWMIRGKLVECGDFSSRVGVSLLLAMLVHECLEVSLTQNNFTYGLLIWTVIGISLALGQSSKSVLNDREGVCLSTPL